MNIADIIESALFAGIPVLIITWFISSLIIFIKTPKDSPKRKGRKIMMIVSSVAAGVMVAAVAGLLILLMLAAASM